MIILLGESCAGKSTIEKRLDLNRIISYTTRPMRMGESNHVDYHFITDKKFDTKFKNNDFVEYTYYNGWNYAVAGEDCKDDSIVTVEPVGYRMLKRNKNLNITCFYIKVDERERMIRMMKRGDIVMEAIRRIISDSGLFSGIEHEIDYIIKNPDGKLEDAIDEIDEILTKNNIY